MKTLDLEGFLELTYLPANNWENRIRKSLNIYVLWSSSKSWNSKLLSRINPGENFRIESSDLDQEYLHSGMCLLYPTDEVLPETMEALPSKSLWSSRIPEWRCTTGFTNRIAQTSYQSELVPLPEKASMLTFHPFIQYENIRNYLLVLNISQNPAIVESTLDFFNSLDGEKRGSEKVRTNSLTCISLDQFGFQPSDLPFFACPTMAGIPFGLGISSDKKMLSMEHTHPPASFVLFGERNKVQGGLKKKWFEKAGYTK